MKWFSTWLLEQAERFFLWAHFWSRDEGYYYPPDDYEFRRHSKYTRSHAVNAQKQLVYNAQYGGTRVDPDLRKEKGHETL